MSWVIVGLAATTMLVLGLVLSFVLGWANRAFHVEVDPRVDAVIDALPGANCGGCGYVGCGEYAEAVVLDDEAVNPCTVGGTKLCGSTGSGHGGGGRRQLSLATGGPKEVKSVCKVGCLGCRACERTSGMFAVVNNCPPSTTTTTPWKT